MPGLTPAVAVQIVEDAYDVYKDLAVDAFNDAVSYVQDLAEYSLPTISIETPTFDPPAFEGMDKPDEPPDPGEIEFELPDPVPPLNLQQPPAINLGTTPTDPGSFSGLSLPDLPDPFDEDAPEAPGAFAEIVMPELVEPTIPDEPTLITEINIPEDPLIEIPEFGEEIPEFELDFDVDSFAYTEEIYNSALLDTLRARITDMVDGGTGLPAAVETALFDRARTKEQDTHLSATQTALEEWSSRGFTLPGGDISRRLREAREARRAAENTINRDIMVRVHEAALDQLKAGVASGVQLEGSLMNYMGGVAQRALEAARATVELSVAVLNARIAFFNVQLQRVTIAAQVYETTVRAALARVEIFKALIEAEKLKIDINQQQIALYQAQINAALSLLEIYKAKLEGVKTEVDIQRNQIEIYKARVDGYTGLVQAKKLEYDGYASAVQGETAKVGIYEATVRAFAARVDAYKTRIDAQSSYNTAFVAAEKNKVDEFDAKVRAYSANVQAVIEQVRAQVQIYGAQTDQYRAKVAYAEAVGRAGVAEAEVVVNAGNAQVQIATQAAISTAQVAIQASAQVLEAIKAAATVQAQLAAGAMSAVNTGASISSTDNLNHNLSGISPQSA